MTNFTYNRDIPNPPNNPSQDVPNMKVNTNSIDDLISVDHYSFNIANGGLHKQVQIPQVSGIPSGLINGTANIYANSANGLTQLFFTNGTSGNAYQLTRGNNANFSTFGTNTAYQNPGSPTANNPTINGGWTFLPGGLLMMYGLATPVGNTGIINFPFTFSTVYSVTMQLVRANTSSVVQSYVNSVSTSQFTYTTNNAASGVGIYFVAIGI